MQKRQPTDRARYFSSDIKGHLVMPPWSNIQEEAVLTSVQMFMLWAERSILHLRLRSLQVYQPATSQFNRVFQTCLHYRNSSRITRPKRAQSMALPGNFDLVLPSQRNPHLATQSTWHSWAPSRLNSSSISTPSLHKQWR